MAGGLADAAELGDLDALQNLLRSGSDANELQNDGSSALLWAAQRDDSDMARALIAAGADPSLANRTGASPLQLAAINGSAAMLRLLIDAGANPALPLSTSGDTALMFAARTGLPEAVKVLLDAGSDVNAVETWGRTTALMWAAREGHAEAVGLLLAAGADPDAQSLYVPIDTARGFEGSAPRPRTAEEIGPIYNASGELTALMFAAREGHLDTARALVDAGADLNKVAGDGKHALNLALFKLSLLIRLTRASTREAVLQDYVKFARAKGLSPRRVVGVHVLNNIMIPIVTVIGLELGSVIAFAIITESIFAWPGTGKLLIDSINQLDRPVIVAYLMVIVTIFVAINFAVDVLYSFLDPRVRLGGAAAAH